MEKKVRNEKNTPSPSSTTKQKPQQNKKIKQIFGTNNSVQLGDNDYGFPSSSLVGGIVEKGFSQSTLLAPSSVPRTTVLPFPVARHRSHGPHWEPIGSDLSGDCNDDEDDGKNMSALANPIQRKQKKGLDFSRWRELTADDPSDPPKTKNKRLGRPQQLNQFSKASEIQDDMNMHMDVEDAIQLQRGSLGNDTKEQDVNMELVDSSFSEVGDEQKPGLFGLSRKQNEADMDKHYMSDSLTSNCGDPVSQGDQGVTSLASQIDAENRERLEKMSPDEIAEAQAELTNKLSPALVEMLKKRAHSKLEKQKFPTSDRGISGQVRNLQDEKNLSIASPFSQSDVSHKMTMPVSTQTTVANNALKKYNPSSSLWETWSKRVEAVRELRFSLEGNVIESSFAQVPSTGNIPANSGYTADNVSERDFIRTEGDPAAAGYTIKEALALIRSVVPGQRVLAMRLLASVLNLALFSICQNQVGSTLEYTNTNKFIDWEAIWSFILGPEPELALLLRMSLDDNHNSVVLACAKVIESVLSCDINGTLLDISEKIASYQKDVYTAPIFRSRPTIEDGFLRGGFWKYNTKPSNLLPFNEVLMDEKPEGENTIQDDVVVAGQDLVAGLVRMGIIERIRYLLEMDPSTALEEHLIAVLIAIARHSPACADAIMKCQRLVQIIVNRFSTKDQLEINPSKIKAVTLVKVLAQSKKNYCIEFVTNGTFQKMTWHLYRDAFTLDYWVNSGRENRRSSSDLLVEQLRFWKVCIEYGYCVSYFADLLPALCIWLDTPTFENLMVENILDEFLAITKEAYLVLEALTRRLPNFYSQVDLEEVAAKDEETWCWSHVGSIVELALKWTALKNDPSVSRFFYFQNPNGSNFVVKDKTVKSLLWVISAVMNMLCSLLARVIPEDISSLRGGHVPWLPEFLPKIGLEIIKNGFFSFTGVTDSEYGKDSSGVGSFVEYLCLLRQGGEHDLGVASVVCLFGLIRVVLSVDKLIQLADIHTALSQPFSFHREDKILANGILKSSVVELNTVLTAFVYLIASEGQYMQFIEMFGRGGPAPGVGAGWGASGGGFWSTVVLLAQMDANLLFHLLEIFPVVLPEDSPNSEEMSSLTQRLNCALHMCLVAGPKDRFMMDQLLGYLFQAPVLRCLDICIRRFIHLNKGFKQIDGQYEEEDFLLFSNILTSHFKNRWLSVKKKSKAESKDSDVHHKTFRNSKVSLATIHEDSGASTMTNQKRHINSLVVEWAHQRLPLPSHWFLSSLSTIIDGKLAECPSASNLLNSLQNAASSLEVARGGLFFLLGIETMSTFLPSELLPAVQGVPISWKVHSLTASLFVGMDILEGKSRDLYENLQELYGQLLDDSRFPQNGKTDNLELLKFQSDIHESYSTFIETVVEQFSALSYGDLIYGRQVSLYLHRCVEAPVRLVAWNSLSNAHVLELLPPIEKCVARVEGYLEPVEDNEKILEAYVKSWTSGALDKAVGRRSVAFTLVLHHLAIFIFQNLSGDRIILRNRLTKSILRDYSHKKQHEGMVMDLIRYNGPSNYQQPGEAVPSLPMREIDKRFKILKDGCEGSSSLMSEVEKLESCFRL